MAGKLATFVGFSIAVLAVIAEAILEHVYANPHDWVIALSIVGVGAGIAGVTLWSNSDLKGVIRDARDEILRKRK